MKVIFLDHDGVMCLSTQWGGRHKKTREWVMKHGEENVKTIPATVRLDNFDEKAVKVLNEILTETSSEIVVSSDWKLHATLDEMKDLYWDYGVIKTPLDFTPNLREFDPDAAALFGWKGWPARARIVEIRKWLENHPEVTNWVAVDDLNMGREGLENFVLTARSSEGIKQSGIKKKIIDSLKDEV
jgi:hypothetical protein